MLEPLLDSIFRQRPAAEWIERLQTAGIPASLVRSFQDVVEHPQSAAREMFPVLQHATAGVHRVTGTPIKLTETPGAPSSSAPLLGQHSISALQELLGIGEAALAALAERGVIFDAAVSPQRS